MQEKGGRNVRGWLVIVVYCGCLSPCIHGMAMYCTQYCHLRYGGYGSHAAHEVLIRVCILYPFGLNR